MPTNKLLQRQAALICGFIWGLSGFLVEFFSESSMLPVLQIAFVIVPLVGLALTQKIRIAPGHSTLGIVFLWYLVAVTISIVFNDNSYSYFFRELLLLAVVLMMVVLLSNGDVFQDFAKGLLYSLMLLVLFYASKIEFIQLLAPYYRLGDPALSTNAGGQGPNGIGSFGALAFVVSYYWLLGGATGRVKKALWAMTVLSLLVVIATRSRTSMGMVVLSFLIVSLMYRKYQVLWVSLMLLMVVVVWRYDQLSSVFRLENAAGYRGDARLENFAGRTALWQNGIASFLDHPIIGVGPGNAFELIGGEKKTYHNAFVQTLVSLGLVGTLPLITLVVVAARNIFARHKSNLAKAVFMVGIVATTTESKLLNYGTPANFLFFLSVLYLVSASNHARINRQSGS